MNFSWAENYPEVLKICTLFNLSDLNAPKRYCYKPLQGYTQKGPQCGIVALAMCSSNPTTEFVEFIYQEATKRQYTSVGEMFSAPNLANLAKIIYPSISAELYSGYLDTDYIRETLLNGKLLLVPFDCDVDNKPGLRNGTRAHWAVVSGAVETETEFYVLARHGKAVNVAVWKINQLADSNAQLNEVAMYENMMHMNFKLPDGGIYGPLGLKCKAIVLSERKTEL